MLFKQESYDIKERLGYGTARKLSPEDLVFTLRNTDLFISDEDIVKIASAYYGECLNILEDITDAIDREKGSKFKLPRMWSSSDAHVSFESLCDGAHSLFEDFEESKKKAEDDETSWIDDKICTDQVQLLLLLSDFVDTDGWKNLFAMANAKTDYSYNNVVLIGNETIKRSAAAYEDENILPPSGIVFSREDWIETFGLDSFTINSKPIKGAKIGESDDGLLEYEEVEFFDACDVVMSPLGDAYRDILKSRIRGGSHRIFELLDVDEDSFVGNEYALHIMSDVAKMFNSAWHLIEKKPLDFLQMTGTHRPFYLNQSTGQTLVLQSLSSEGKQGDDDEFIKESMLSLFYLLSYTVSAKSDGVLISLKGKVRGEQDLSSAYYEGNVDECDFVALMSSYLILKRFGVNSARLLFPEIALLLPSISVKKMAWLCSRARKSASVVLLRYESHKTLVEGERGMEE